MNKANTLEFHCDFHSERGSMRITEFLLYRDMLRLLLKSHVVNLLFWLITTF